VGHRLRLAVLIALSAALLRVIIDLEMELFLLAAEWWPFADTDSGIKNRFLTTQFE